MKKIIYINLVTVSESSENIESLPEITIVDNGTSKYISKGLFEVEAAIIEIVEEHLGQDYSELIPFAVEEREIVTSSTLRQRRR